MAYFHSVFRKSEKLGFTDKKPTFLKRGLALKGNKNTVLLTPMKCKMTRNKKW